MNSGAECQVARGSFGRKMMVWDAAASSRPHYLGCGVAGGGDCERAGDLVE